MKILAIETSCDDTCIALAECPARNATHSVAGGPARRFKLISNLVSSQIEIHRKWGGVYPALARREHQKNLVPLLEKALAEATLLKLKVKSPKLKVTVKSLKLKKVLEREAVLHKNIEKFFGKYQKPKIDLIAVTVGPGLDPCLWTGINFAKALAYYWNLPIVSINHIEAHIFANWLEPISSNVKRKTKNLKQQRKTQKLEKIKFPAICLIVSGGHTQLILIKKLGRYKILGETRDDAAGEAFDKIARILGLGYPGGPAIAAAGAAAQMSNVNLRPELRSRECQMSNPSTPKVSGPRGKFKIELPRPMLHSKNYDFSFSGLKTAVLYNYKKRTKKERESKEYVGAMAHQAQQAIIDVLTKKTIRAARDYKAKSILLGGGVAANKELRKQFRQKIQKENSRFRFHVSSSKFCTDNAAMVAAAACLKTSRGQTSGNWQKIKAEANLRIADTGPRQ